MPLDAVNRRLRVRNRSPLPGELTHDPQFTPAPMLDHRRGRARGRPARAGPDAGPAVHSRAACLAPISPASLREATQKDGGDGTSFAMSRGGPAAQLVIRVLPVTLAVAGLMLVLASETRAQGFTGGPSVRVTPNVNVEIRWAANFVGDGWVEIFDNPNGGAPIDVNGSSVSATGHTIGFGVGGLLQADTTYFFRVRHRDPNNAIPDLTNDPAPYPPFFTGTQAITNVFVDPDLTSAVISWEANVLGYGSVVYGTTALDQGPVEDTVNITTTPSSSPGCRPARPISSKSATSTRSTGPAWPRRRPSSRRRRRSSSRSCSRSRTPTRA